MFWLSMAGSTFVAGWLALFWYVSPLAVGFSDWPDDAARRELALGLYDLSWHVGIPALLVAQGLALVLAWRECGFGPGYSPALPFWVLPR